MHALTTSHSNWSFHSCHCNTLLALQPPIRSLTFMESPAPSLGLESGNKAIVESLYEALACGGTDTISCLLARDLEWWFHGPPHCQHMMRFLTGKSEFPEFRFTPRRITAVGNWVFAEGWEGAQEYWVHVWTLNEGLITQLREYFNTWLTVQDLRPLAWEARNKGSTLWQSEPREYLNQSLPGLVLAIWSDRLLWSTRIGLTCVARILKKGNGKN